MADPDAILFNLSKHRSFPCVDHEEAIYRGKYLGPSFGLGELTVFEEPFNKPNACYSLANFHGYEIPVNDEGINMLTNKKNTEKNSCYFTITEIEVWGVTFLE
jgi:hypothetical protein